MVHKSANRWRRLTVRQLRAFRARLVRRLPDLQATLQGALQRQMRQCGEPGCRCAAGERHGPYLYLAVRVGARRRLLYIPARAAARVEQHVQTTGCIEDTLAEISAINLELFARGALD